MSLDVGDTIYVVMPVPSLHMELIVNRISGLYGARRYTVVYNDMSYCIINDNDLLYLDTTPLVLYDTIESRLQQL